MAFWKATLGLIVGVVLVGCTTVNCTVLGDENFVNIDTPKSVSTTPSVTASGNTLPLLK